MRFFLGILLMLWAAIEVSPAQEFYILNQDMDVFTSRFEKNDNGLNFATSPSANQMGKGSVFFSHGRISIEINGVKKEVIALQHLEFENQQGVRGRRATNHMVFVDESQMRMLRSAKVIERPGQTYALQINETRHDELRSLDGSAIACPPSNPKPSETAAIIDAAQTEPSPSVQLARIQRPKTQADLNARLADFQKRKNEYQEIINHFEKMSVAPELLSAIRRGASESELREHRRSGMRSLLKAIEDDPFFQGEVGKRRIDDLILVMTLSQEFMVESHQTPMNVLGAAQSIKNRAAPGGVTNSLYCDISAEYCADIHEQILGRRDNWLDQSVAGVSLAGTLLRSKEERLAKLSTAESLLFRMREQEAGNRSASILAQEIKGMGQDDKTALIRRFIQSKKSSSAQLDSTEVFEAIEKLKPRFTYQYSAWDSRSPNLGQILLLTEPSAQSATRGERVAMQRIITLLARNESGLLIAESQSQNDHGFGAITHYYSPEAMIPKNSAPPWAAEMVEINYPRIVAFDERPDGKPRVNHAEEFRTYSNHRLGDFRGYRPKTKGDKK